MQHDAAVWAPETKLRPVQLQVLDSLLQGETIVSAAHTAGVDRTTVHRWLARDFAFQAALNHRRHELRVALVDRLAQLAAAAVDVVEQALRDGDARVGLAVLKGTGLLSGALVPIGSRDPKALQEESAMRDRDRELEAAEKKRLQSLRAMIVQD